jgi:hypothetical protein
MTGWDSPGWKKAAVEHHANHPPLRSLRAVSGNEQKLKAKGHNITSIAFSDLALAKDFANQNINLLRFVPLMGRWFVWDGKRWEMDVRLLARERAKETCRTAATECDKAKMAKLIASA